MTLETLTAVVARRVKEVRQSRGWSAQALATACADHGMPQLTRSTIANIESGRRSSITVDEVMVLAYVLDIAPVHLLTPADDDEDVTVGVERFRADQVRRFIRGSEALSGMSRRLFFSQIPESEWWETQGQPPELVEAQQSLEHLLAMKQQVDLNLEAEELTGPPNPDDEYRQAWLEMSRRRKREMDERVQQARQRLAEIRRISLGEGDDDG